MKYVVTSGWWCGVARDEKRVRYGSEQIRELSFFKLWKKSVLENSSPQKIMVLDSASDEIPDNEDLQGVEFISLLENAGHSTNHKGKFSGYMRSIIMGITYAKLCDSDYWVYVEQDVLLKGKGVIEHCIESMTKPYMFGDGKGTPQFLQQSLIIIHKDGFDSFLAGLSKISSYDYQISPETKFLIASSKFYQLIPEKIYRRITTGDRLGRFYFKLLKLFLPIFKNYDHLPIGYGRARPIDFQKPFYYFQHGTEEELNKYFEL